MTVSQTQAHTNLHGYIRVLAQHLFSDSPAPVYTHKHVRAYAHIPLLAEQDPSVPNLALNVTNGVSCEHPGHPGEENRRTEEKTVFGGLDGQRKKLTKTISKVTVKKGAMHAHPRAPKALQDILELF